MKKSDGKALSGIFLTVFILGSVELSTAWAKGHGKAKAGSSLSDLSPAPFCDSDAMKTLNPVLRIQAQAELDAHYKKHKHLFSGATPASDGNRGFKFGDNNGYVKLLEEHLEREHFFQAYVEGVVQLQGKYGLIADQRAKGLMAANHKHWNQYNDRWAKIIDDARKHPKKSRHAKVDPLWFLATEAQAADKPKPGPDCSIYNVDPDPKTGAGQMTYTGPFCTTNGREPGECVLAFEGTGTYVPGYCTYNPPPADGNPPPPASKGPVTTESYSYIERNAGIKEWCSIHVIGTTSTHLGIQTASVTCNDMYHDQWRSSSTCTVAISLPSSRTKTFEYCNMSESPNYGKYVPIKLVHHFEGLKTPPTCTNDRAYTTKSYDRTLTKSLEAACNCVNPIPYLDNCGFDI